MEADFRGMDILVCDDLGHEVSDFLAADTIARRAVFIHTKASAEPTRRSASAFHVVCSQAVKSLDYVHPYSLGEPGNVSAWDRPWRASIGKVVRRVRRGTGTPRSIWGAIQQVIRDPGSVREVWIVLASGFSVSDFQEECERANPRPEIVQILYLLQSTWAAVSAVGAILRIYCSP